MASGPGLQQVQRQALQQTQTLAPQLQQSLQLLQVSALELNQLVHEELQQNPLLEELPPDESPRAEAETSPPDSPEPVQSDVEFKHVDEGLAQEPQLTSIRVLMNQIDHGGLRQVADSRHPW